MSHPLNRLRHRDQGSVSIWLATASFVMVVLVGLAVDLGGQVHAQQRARDVATQAARAGGQSVLAPAAIRGHGPQADPAMAAAAAQDYLHSAGIPGTVSVEGTDTIVVQTRHTYDTKFLSIIGIGSLPVSGQATSRMVHVLEGSEQ